MNQIAIMSPEQIKAIINLAIDCALSVFKEKKHGKKLLSGKDVETEYGISERNLERWRNEGVGPQYITIGRRIFYERVTLDAYIDARRVKTTDTDH